MNKILVLFRQSGDVVGRDIQAMRGALRSIGAKFDASCAIVCYPAILIARLGSVTALRSRGCPELLVVPPSVEGLDGTDYAAESLGNSAITLAALHRAYPEDFWRRTERWRSFVIVDAQQQQLLLGADQLNMTKLWVLKADDCVLTSNDERALLYYAERMNADEPVVVQRLLPGEVIRVERSNTVATLQPSLVG